jgi:hypothetical protein
MQRCISHANTASKPIPGISLQCGCPPASGKASSLSKSLSLRDSCLPPISPHGTDHHTFRLSVYPPILTMDLHTSACEFCLFIIVMLMKERFHPKWSSWNALVKPACCKQAKQLDKPEWNVASRSSSRSCHPTRTAFKKRNEFLLIFCITISR